MKKSIFKLLSIMLAFVMMNTSTTYFAAEIPDESSSLESAFEKAHLEALKSPTVRDGVSHIDHQAIREITGYYPQVGISTIDNFTDAFATAARLDLASLFSIEDGLTYSQASTMFNNAVNAKLKSTDRTDEDPYRHFVWSFNSSIALGITVAQTFTCNYEWSNILYEAYNTELSTRYEHYRSIHFWSLITGVVDETYIMNFAIADADDYILRVRANLINDCESSYSYFIEEFKEDGIMDLWNNYVGRCSSSLHPTYTVDEAYALATNNSLLILTPQSIENTASTNDLFDRYASDIYTNDLW